MKAVCILVICLLIPRFVSAQTLSGVVVDSAGSPVAGALVEVSAGQLVYARGASSATGAFVVPVQHAGVFTIRVSRIGYAYRDTSGVALRSGDTAFIRIRVADDPIVLRSIEVEGSRGCRESAQAGAAAALIWEEVRKALQLTALAEHDTANRYLARRYLRDTDTTGTLTVRVHYETAFEGSGPPFATRPADFLARNGFAGIEGDSIVLFGPTADLLVSREFADTHCFSVTENRQQGLVGLAFEPRRRRPPDIAGVLWVDMNSGELRSLDFEYVNHRWAGPRHMYSGRLEFARTSGGRWFTNRWYIRTPILERFTSTASRDLRQTWEYVTSLREDGGYVYSILPTIEPR